MTDPLCQLTDQLFEAHCRVHTKRDSPWDRQAVREAKATAKSLDAELAKLMRVAGIVSFVRNRVRFRLKEKPRSGGLEIATTQMHPSLEKKRLWDKRFREGLRNMKQRS